MDGIREKQGCSQVGRQLHTILASLRNHPPQTLSALGDPATTDRHLAFPQSDRNRRAYSCIYFWVGQWSHDASFDFVDAAGV